MYGRLEAARALLAAGADPTVPNNEGLTPMLATLSGGHRAKGRAIAGLLEVSRTTERLTDWYCVLSVGRS